MLYEKYLNYEEYNVGVQNIPKVVLDIVRNVEKSKEIVNVFLVSKGSTSPLYIMHLADENTEYFQIISVGEKPITEVFKGAISKLEYSSLKTKLSLLIGRIVGEYQIDGTKKILCTEDLSPIMDIESFIESIS